MPLVKTCNIEIKIKTNNINTIRKKCKHRYKYSKYKCKQSKQITKNANKVDNLNKKILNKSQKMQTKHRQRDLNADGADKT